MIFFIFMLSCFCLQLTQCEKWSGPYEDAGFTDELDDLGPMGFENYRHLSLPANSQLIQLSEADRVAIHGVGTRELDKQYFKNLKTISSRVQVRLNYLDKLEAMDSKLSDPNEYSADQCLVYKKGKDHFDFYRKLYIRQGEAMKANEKIWFSAKVKYLDVVLGINNY